MVELKVTTVGNSTGVVPKDDKHDATDLTEAAHNLGFRRQMELARRVMNERHEVLKVLAK